MIAVVFILVYYCPLAPHFPISKLGEFVVDILEYIVKFSSVREWRGQGREKNA